MMIFVNEWMTEWMDGGQQKERAFYSLYSYSFGRVSPVRESRDNDPLIRSIHSRRETGRQVSFLLDFVLT